MSLMDVASKSAGGRVLRVNVLNKFKMAISLIVTRGADAEIGEGEQRIVFKSERLGGEWVLSGVCSLALFVCHADILPFSTLRSGRLDVHLPS